MFDIISAIHTRDGTTVLGIAAFLVSVILVISYLLIRPSVTHSSKRKNVLSKEERSKALRQAFNEIESRATKTNSQNDSASPSSLTISQLWIYPIKSLRGCKVTHALLTKEGFYHDRRFMILKDHQSTPPNLENMHVPNFPSMTLFHPSIDDNKIVVRYRAPGTAEPASDDTLEVPLHPENLESLEKLSVMMHGSPTSGYNMGEKCNQWFSERFGFRVVLAYWGGNPRTVLGNLPPAKTGVKGPEPKTPLLQSVSQAPILRSLMPGPAEAHNDKIAFNDCAPYLVINEQSVADVTRRLPEGMEMDHTKFRPNVVVRGADAAFEEDFWGELTVGGSSDARLILTGNCARCMSINIDYDTGAAGTGPVGAVLKLLQKDRRVDPGVKYSPIFGRYGFASGDSEGTVLSVGDKVAVSRKNEKRTVFYWPGISTS